MPSRRGAAGWPRPVPALAVVAVTLGTGCAIQPDNAPRDIPADRARPARPGAAGSARPPGRAGSTSSPTRARGRPGAAHRPARRRAARRPEAVLRTLIAGPNQGELDGGMTSPLPPSSTLHSARLVAGTLNVDLSGEILELPGSSLRSRWPRSCSPAASSTGCGPCASASTGRSATGPTAAASCRRRPLTVYDYPGLAESAQPPYPPIPSESRRSRSRHHRPR